MNKALAIGVGLSASLLVAHATLPVGAPAQAAKSLRVISQETATGFKFPEAVVHDPNAGVLYVGQFGSELKPTQKDGQGKISKVSLSGKVVDEKFLPGPNDTLHKPKGMWVDGDRLWVSDIDVVWVFDLESRRGRKVALPGVQFANDVAVQGKALYVSDNRGDQLFRVEPADFLETKDAPKVTTVFTEKSVNPNGIYPARDGSLLLVGFAAKDQPRGIYTLSASGEIKTLAKDLGRLDGVYPLDDGGLLVTEWNSGSLARWSSGGRMEPLAKDFKGPADFAVVPDSGGLLVVVPDLVKSELRLVRLSK